MNLLVQGCFVLSREEIVDERRQAAEALQDRVHVARVTQVLQAREPREVAPHLLHRFLAGIRHTFQANRVIVPPTRRKTHNRGNLKCYTSFCIVFFRKRYRLEETFAC